jgi:hypothetical protein
MSDSVLARPQVKEYLRALDAACASLPVAQAEELHEMIAAHLDETLAPGASIAEVRAELNRLGPPGSLAATAAGPSRFPAPVTLVVLRRLRNQSRRVRWRTWVAAAVLVPALGTGAGLLISMNSAAPLTSDAAGWLYPADQARAVEVSAEADTQTTVPVRSGQRQGIEMLVWNYSDWTQVILGPGPHWQPFSDEPIQISVQTGGIVNQDGTVLSGRGSYVSPGAIAPHTARWVRVIWTSDACMPSSEVGIITVIPLQVRVGVITRTEDVTPIEGFALQGPGRGSYCDATSGVTTSLGNGLSGQQPRHRKTTGQRTSVAR